MLFPERFCTTMSPASVVKSREIVMGPTDFSQGE
jgi:hypothetical protein